MAMLAVTRAKARLKRHIGDRGEHPDGVEHLGVQLRGKKGTPRAGKVIGVYCSCGEWFWAHKCLSSEGPHGADAKREDYNRAMGVHPRDPGPARVKRKRREMRKRRGKQGSSPGEIKEWWK